MIPYHHNYFWACIAWFHFASALLNIKDLQHPTIKHIIKKRSTEPKADVYALHRSFNIMTPGTSKSELSREKKSAKGIM